ncbi:hypothetical protein [Haloarcula sp. CBA1127]|uniref:hypothetical protein n=1 Tax=Haloarcula sp. CBA1127 TaxID=1765055 RepID=UPI00073E2F0C|nr:hypothetical protein [Haloarcula sp. CBA1127]
MSGSSGDSGSKDPEEHDIESLRLSQEEARAVLDHQIESFRRIDDKAAKTFRLNGLLLGLILTAVSLLARSQSLNLNVFINNWTLAGIVLLLISFILAIITYTVTDVNTGLNGNDINRLIDRKYPEKDWLILLLRSEAAWMRENEDRQDTNATLLSASHLCLIFGVVFLAIGAAIPYL